jgi:hypothetical protein
MLVALTTGLCVLALFVLVRPGQSVESARSAGPGTPGVLPTDEVYFPIVVRVSGAGECTLIQAAINGLPPEGGQVLLSSGIYTCHTPIMIDRDYVDLRGQGATTVLSLADGANSPVIVIGQTIAQPTVTRHHIRVADLAIRGNRAQQTHECWGGPCDTGGLTAIRNNGLALRRVSDVQVERVWVEGARSGGLVTERGSRRITVRDLTSTDNEFDGLAAYQTEDSLFTQLFLHDNPNAGLSFDLGFNNNVVTQAVLTDNGHQGLFMRDSRDNVFSAIQIRGSGQQGIFLAQAEASGTAATGNTFSDLTVSGSAQAGLRVNDASCTNNLVVGAQFAGNQGCISEAVPGLVLQSAVVCR